MKIFLPRDNFQMFLFNLLALEKELIDDRFLLWFLIYNENLIKDSRISNCLRFHFNFEYAKSYNELHIAKSFENFSGSFLEQFTKLLLNLEYLNTKLHLNGDLNFSHVTFLNSKAEILSCLGLRLKQFEFKDTGRIFGKISFLLKEFNQLSFNPKEDLTTTFKNLFDNYALISNIFQTNQVYVTDEQVYDLKHKPSFFGSIDEKLNHIERDLNEIQFHHLINLTLNSNEEKEYSEEVKNQRDTDDNFLFKLKVFNKLKQYHKNRKNKKKLRQELEVKEVIARNFHLNLLRYRTFYGLQKLSKRLNYFRIIQRNYREYTEMYSRRSLIKNLVCVYNRRKIIETHHEHLSKKLKTKLFQHLVKKTQFRSNYNKVYLSQLLNNSYSTRFLMKVCEVAIDNQVKFREKLITNFKKLRVLNVFNEKKTIFKSLVEGIMLNQSTFGKREKRIQEFSVKFFLKRMTSFLNTTKEGMIRKMKIKQFQMKLFLLRFYYSKYKTNYIMKLLEQRHNEFRSVFSFRINFFSFMKNLTMNKQVEVIKTKSKLYLRNRMGENLNHLKKFSSETRKVKMMQRNRPMINFFNNVKVNRIESLLVQGIKERIKSYKRKELLSLMISSSLTKIKTKQALLHRERGLKRNLFKNLSLDNALNTPQRKDLMLRLCYRNFLSKVYCWIKSRNQIRTLILLHYSRKSRYNYKYFIMSILKQMKKKQIKLKGKFLQNILLRNKLTSFFQMTKMKIKGLPITYTRKFNFRIFFIKAFKSLNIRQVKKHKQANLLRDFLRRINTRIKTKAIKLFLSRFIQIKGMKTFLKNVYKKLDLKFFQSKLIQMKVRYYSKLFYSIMDISSKNAKLTHQINSFSILRTRRKIFDRLKSNYVKEIKFQMLRERYIQYVTISTLSLLANHKVK